MPGFEYPCGLKCNYGHTSKLYFFSSDEREKLEFLGAIVGAKNLSLCVELKVSFFNNNASEEKKARGKALY